MKGINLFLAPGFEDMEAIATRDVLVRAGLEVRLVSTTDDYLVESSHGVAVSADVSRSDFDFEEEGTFREDVMIFPGGMPGTKNLAGDKDLMERMREHYAAGGTLAAICAAPGLVLSQLDTLDGVRFTCFDGFEDAPQSKGGEYVKAPAVVSGRIITGRGAGCAVDFGLAIVDYLCGPDVAARVRSSLML